MRSHATLLAVCVGCLIVCGCASVVPHHDQPPGAMEGVPRGLYAVTVHVRGIGPFCGSTTALIAAEPSEDGFRANSRPRAAGELLGGLPGFYVNLIGDKRVPGGAFLHWYGPAPGTDRAARGIFESPRANLHADFYSYDKPIELRPMDDERLFGLMTLAPAIAGDFPKTDYSALIDRIDAELRANLFDPAAYEAPETQGFLRRLREAGRKARDDAEFLMAWMFASRHLTFSHCYVGRELDPEFESRLAETSSTSPLTPGKSKAISITSDEEIVTLRIASFEGDSYDGIDEAFADIIGRDPRGLIIDLRDNPGGTYISGRVAAHLIESAVDMGVFFDRRARSRVLARELSDFPTVTSISSEDEFNSLIREHGAFVGIVEPVDPIYAGPVVVLVNAKTASACEPLVAGLQEIGRATIIGEQTAAAMLWITEHEVGEGWILWVPTVDYLTGQGVRLDGRGVVPDIETSSEEAFQAARKHLNAVNR
ncbi:MAG: S41 family peptidase [Candidatus Eisenbacteria sp.]|nr:S41 family peptidase [Candidatus Eisenbacteria bacterium]